MSTPSSATRRDRLFELMPVIYKSLDDLQAVNGPPGPLRELLTVIGEQANLIEDDLARWYDNWFIETCEDWVVPYIGDLVRYESAARELATGRDPESPLNRAVVFPRREVADIVGLRKRKGSLAVLEELSSRIVGWPARAVEYRWLTAGTASLNHLRRRRSSTVDLREGRLLSLIDSPFDELPRSVDLRRIDSHRTRGFHNLPAIGLFVCRRKIDSATIVRARHYKSADRRTFDALGATIPLHVLPQPHTSTCSSSDIVNLPVPLTQSLLRRDLLKSERLDHDPDRRIVGANERFYGVGKSVFVIAKYGNDSAVVPADKIFVTDLSDWEFSPSDDDCNIVAVDPESGRLAFHPDQAPDSVWTGYHYGRPALMGGGEYNRNPDDSPVWGTVERSSSTDPAVSNNYRKLTEAIHNWSAVMPPDGHTVIEIVDNEEYSADFHVTIPAGKTLEIRAANHFRPVLRVPDDPGQELESCHFTGKSGCSLILDGLLFAEGTLLLDGEFDLIQIRHCTLAPGLTQLVIRLNDTDVEIDSSIIGAVQTLAPEPRSPGTIRNAGQQPPVCAPAYNEPVSLVLRDSLLDGTGADPDRRLRQRHGHADREFALLGADRWAQAVLTAIRTTVLGEVEVHRIGLIENCIFRDRICVENCMTGCVRFSWIAPRSCAPAQFHCQPMLAVERLSDTTLTGNSDVVATPDSETQRVTPRFLSTTYSNPDYARLTDDCALEILQGSDDEAEMGVYHNEFFLQRATHLRQRIQEFIPAGSDAEIIFEN